MKLNVLLKSLASVAISVAIAGVFFVGWLGVFIPAFKTDSTILRLTGWLSAPIVTALGFASGLWLADRMLRPGEAGFLRVLMWPFVGCVLGAVAVFWFGPMLIVFGMFTAGTMSIILREAFLILGYHRSAGVGQFQHRD